MQPTIEEANKSYQFFLILVDNNESNPKDKTYEFTVEVHGPNISTETVPKPKRKEEIAVTISSPDAQGIFAIQMSKAIRLPKNYTEWTEKNEGSEKIKIEYMPTEETLTYLYDVDIEVNMHWKVIQAEKKSSSDRRRL